jgi:hypothetical protein
MGGNHGNLNNFASNGNDAYVTSADRLAINFDGINDRVSVNTLNLNTLDFAISFWAQQRGAGAIGMPIGNSGTTNSYIWFRSGNYLRFQIPAGNVEFAGVTTFTALRHYCLFSTPSTAALSTINLFADGVSIGALSLAAGTFSINSIGDGYSGNSFPFPGVIDDVIVFGQGLRPHEPRFLFDQGRGGGLLYQPPRRRSYYAQLAAAFSILAESGSYSISGQPIPLLYGRVLPADTGSVLLSGQTTPLLTSRLLNADQGSYAYSGTDAAMLLGRLLDAGAAAYTLDGNAAGFLASRRISADSAAYLASGLDTGFLRSRVLEAGTGQYVLVASPVNITTGTGGAAPYYYLFLLGGSR